MLHRRIGVFAALPLGALDRLSLQKRLREIGSGEGVAAEPTERA
jgi:hypothetical protein